MSLKKVEISRIFKKRKARDLFLAEESLVSKPNQNHDTMETAAELKKYRYQPLKFSKDGSTRCSSLYKIKDNSTHHKEEVTVIPETDNECEGEGQEIIPLKKLQTMAERYHPKVKSTDTIILYSSSDGE